MRVTVTLHTHTHTHTHTRRMPRNLIPETPIRFPPLALLFCLSTISLLSSPLSVSLFHSVCPLSPCLSVHYLPVVFASVRLSVSLSLSVCPLSPHCLPLCPSLCFTQSVCPLSPCLSVCPLSPRCLPLCPSLSPLTWADGLAQEMFVFSLSLSACNLISIHQ